jgi:diguanylate cyclase (GGDEF)-like protein/PAS domain S-box-containing protein
VTYSAAQWNSYAFGATSCSVLVTDATLPDNPIAFVNPAFSTLYGYSQSEAIGRNCRFLQGSETDRQVVANIRAAVAAGVGIQCELLNYRSDGTSFWNELTIDPIRDEAGLITGFVGVQHEVDAAHLAIQQRIEAEARLESIAANVPGFIYRRVMHPDGTIQTEYSSPSLGRMLEIDETDGNLSLYDYVHPDDRDRVIAAIRRSAISLESFREEFRLVSASGKVHWLRSESPARRMANGEIVWDGLALEINAEKRWQSEIADLALRDPLTNLLTREAWRQALIVQLAEGDERRPCALLYFDIASFHDLNTTYGPAGGDEILREVARRLITIAASVGGVAARLGGDEFAILVPDCACDEALATIDQTAAHALALPIRFDNQSAAIRIRIGTTFYTQSAGEQPSGQDAVAELKAQAEIALRSAKQSNTRSPVRYAAALDDRFCNSAVLAASLEQAIADDELELHYQPLVDLASGRIVSAEALVRWNHPTLGMQRPDLFIPLAEKSGLIVPLGRWVLDQALRQRELWRKAGLTPPPIAINVSGNQLIEPGFVGLVAQSLEAAGANADGLELELTEGLLIEPSPQILTALHALRGMGFTIAIDDFGSGHATFRYLRDFPVDKLKIDQIFVRKLVLESTDALIIRAIISLARSMGVAFVAEGIETEMQREFLEREGCLIGQGYLFSMPLRCEDFAWMLSNDVRLPLRGTDVAAETAS